MKTVLVAQSKGGVGKSTLVCLQAMALNHCGVAVAVCDLDMQGTTSSWLTEQLPKLPNIEILPQPDTKPSRPAALLLIDTAGRGDFAAIMDTMPAADLYLVPATPAIEDIRIAGKTVALLKQHRPQAVIRLIWNRIREGHSDSDETYLQAFTEQIGVPALRNRIHESKPYRDARFPPPTGGWARATTSKYAKELPAVATEILSLLV
ncbi:ParA family protein [Oleiharenicola sp. Vm1]|uniref:ParA family protein n=1 Tax=Oleiharenicola sp. Vm1 TaxID=3398393 RepID=UPI0039F47E3F